MPRANIQKSVAISNEFEIWLFTYFQQAMQPRVVKQGHVKLTAFPEALTYAIRDKNGYRAGFQFSARFVLVEPDSVRFHHDIIFCLKSDSIVVSFS